MTRVAIAYTTLFGHTEQLAGEVAAGAREVPGTEVDLVPGDELREEHVRRADALVLGAAVHMAGADARMRQTVETVLYQLWLTDDAVGKVGAVFTVGGGFGSAGGGAELAQLNLLGALAECGMVLVPFPKSTPGADHGGTFWAPHGRTGGLEMQPQDLDEHVLQSARHHGANVARVAGALAGRDLLARGNHVPRGEVLAAFQGALARRA